MSIYCYERPGKLPDYFYLAILKVDLGDFKITDEFISDTAELSDKESRRLAEMLSKFCKDGSCSKDAAKSGAKVNALWSKYKLALYVDKLNKYVDTMEVNIGPGSRLPAFSLGDDCYDLELYDDIELYDFADDPLYDKLCEIKEQFLALKHYEYGTYNYTDRFDCSNVKEYSRSALTKLLKMRSFLAKNKIDYHGSWLLDEVIEQLETIIEYGRLIKNNKKRNDFLRMFDFGFFNTWKEKLEDIDIREEMNTTDDYWNPIIEYDLNGVPKHDDD